MSWLWLAIPLGLAVAGVVLYLTIRSGVIWEGIYAALKRAAKAIFIAMLPGILKIFKPASTEELAEIKKADDRGNERDRFNKGSGRLFDRGKE